MLFDTSVDMLFEFAWKSLYQWKGFHTPPRRCLSYIFGQLLLWLPQTAAVVLEQFRIELFAGVQFCSSQWLFSFLALNLLME